MEPHGTLTQEVQRFADFALGITEIRLLVTSLLAILAAYIYQKRRREPGGEQTLFLQTGVVGGIVAVAANWLLRTAGGAVVSYAVMIAVLILPGSFLLLYRKPDGNPRPVRGSAFWQRRFWRLAAAVAYVPHRMYGHYLLLMVFPLTYSDGVARCGCLRGRRAFGLARARRAFPSDAVRRFRSCSCLRP